MKRLILLLLLVLAGLALALIVLPSREPSFDSPASLMADYHDDGHRLGLYSPFSGVVLVAKDEKVLFQEAFGQFDRDRKRPLEVDSKFLIGSITKQFTAMLVLQQVERGTIRLDQSVAELLPGFPAAVGREMTVERLLSHTAGLPHYAGLATQGLGRKEFFSSAIAPREYAKLISRMPRIYAPGSRFHYSSFDYVLLGAILEQATGRSYAELLESYVTGPLGLGDTGYAPNEFIETEIARDYRFQDFAFARAFGWSFDGSYSPSERRDQSTTYSTGGIHSTAADMFRWTRAVRNSALLSKELTKKMFTPNLWGYGFGWYVNPEDQLRENPDVRLVAHSGEVTGYNSYVGMYSDRTTIIVLSNVGPLNLTRLAHDLHLLANDQTAPLEPILPDPGRFASFENEGGGAQYVGYHRLLSRRAGYPICPAGRSLDRVIALYLDHDRQEAAFSVADAIAELCAEASEEILNSTGYRYLSHGLTAEALAAFERNVALYPQSPNCHDSLGEGLEAAGEPERALEHFEQAVKLATRYSDFRLPAYRAHLFGLRERLP